MTLAAALVAAAATIVAASQALSPPDAMLARLAIDLAVEREAAPISIDADGSRRHGVVYDRFTNAHLAARVAKLRGRPFDPRRPPVSLLNKWLVVVAVPLACGDRIARPIDVDVIGADGRAVRKFAAQRGGGIQSLLPGAVTPAGALAVPFADTVLRGKQRIRISYSGRACPDGQSSLSFPVTMAAAGPRERPTLEVMPGQASSTERLRLNIQGVVDLEGLLRYASAPEASTELGATALKIALRTRFEPARINGSPAPWTSGVILDFSLVAPQ